MIGPAGLPLSPLLHVLALELLFRSFRDEGAKPALRGVLFAGPLTVRVSAFKDDITVFVSHRLDIKAVKKAVAEYERIVGAEVNFDKSKYFWLGAWRGSDTLPRSSAEVTGPSASSGCGSGPTSNWSEIDRRYTLRWMLWWEPGFQGGYP